MRGFLFTLLAGAAAATGAWSYLQMTLRPFDWAGGGACLIDANGDGTPDPVGRAFSFPSGIRALDGRSGRVLWSSRVGGDEVTRIFCAGPAAVLVASPGLRLRRLDPRSGQTLWVTRLGGEPSALIAGPGCARLTLDDQAPVALDLATGAAVQRCDASAPEGGAGHRVPLHGEVRFDDLVVRLETADAQRRVQLSAFDASGGEVPRWRTTVEVRLSGLVGGAHATDRGLFVAGNHPDDDGLIAYAFVRAKDGQVIYQRTLQASDRSDAVLWEMAASGDLAFLHFERALAAVDIRTGARRWQRGRHGD